MTDDEYNRFLQALAGKHMVLGGHRPSDEIGYLRHELEKVSATTRLWKAASVRYRDQELVAKLFKELELSSVESAARLMEDAGILDALDESSGLVLREFRRSVIPPDDIELLRRAGFSDDDIEVLVCVAVEQAHNMDQYQSEPSRVLVDAKQALSIAIQVFQQPPTPEKKKRKILNGIGKILGGAVAGVGNVLLATGTIIAPNPATAAAAIASGGLAVSSMFAGLGDLHGE
jgi:hypothetical protein